MSNYVYEPNLVPGLNACHLLPSGRILCRHPNNEGSVLVFDQYGIQTKLYIPDAKYRNFYPRCVFYGDTWEMQLHTPILVEKDNIYLGFYLFDSSISETEFLTDEQLQTKLNSTLSSGSFKDDFTAKAGTDAILSLDKAYDPITFTRELIPTGLRGCDIPNIYELSVIWLERNYIDFIDPTINDYPNLKLGNPINEFNNTYFHSCSEVQFKTSTTDIYFGGKIINFNNANGELFTDFRNHNCLVLPVLEL